MDGFRLSRNFSTLQPWSEQPCVRIWTPDLCKRLEAWLRTNKLQPYIRLLSDDLVSSSQHGDLRAFSSSALRILIFIRRTHQVQKAPVRPECHVLQVSSQLNFMSALIGYYLAISNSSPFTSSAQIVRANLLASATATTCLCRRVSNWRTHWLCRSS